MRRSSELWTRADGRVALLEEPADALHGLVGGGGIGLGEDRAQSGGDHLLSQLGHGGQGVAHEVDSTALPTGADQELGHRLLEPEVGVRGDLVSVTLLAAGDHQL